MTITGLNDFLSNKARNFSIPNREGWLSQFKGKRIAIDGNGMMHQFMSVAQKEVSTLTDFSIATVDRDRVINLWHRAMLRRLISMIDANIHPVMVFDGTSVIEKAATKLERKEKSIKRDEEIAALEKQVKEAPNILAIPDEVMSRLRKLYAVKVYVSSDDQAQLRTILSEIGIPVVRATTEAEALCSSLCINGIVDAVMSEDTDCLALGCPIIIKKMFPHQFRDGGWDCPITLIYLSEVLQMINLRYDSFVDVCIMAGCDFNVNIPKLGITTAYKYILECGSIENLPDKVKQHEGFEDLNYKKCRELFIVPEWKPLVAKMPNSFNVTLGDDFRDVLSINDLLDQADALVKVTMKLESAEDRKFKIRPNDKLVIF